MDAVEYIKHRNRLCEFHQHYCFECEYAEGERRQEACDCAEYDDPQKAVEIVENWAKEHPARTRQSAFLERYPNARIDEDGVLVICPRSIEQNGCDKFDDHILMCSDCRRKYWSEEVQDDD